MAYVQTVTGRIHPDQMGITAMHEHLLWGPTGWQHDPEWFHSVPKIVEKCYNDMLDYRAEGGLTFVELSGLGLGRDIELYRMVASSSRINLVACTGYWAQRGVPTYFYDKDIDYHEALMVKEITQGMGTTNVKAGIIKVGHYRNGISAWEEMTFRAAARAAKKTGAAVTTHGIEFAEKHCQILLSEGLDPERIIIGHLDSAHCIDLERDKRIGRTGVWLGYDHCTTCKTWSPMHYACSDEERADLVKHMVDAGFENQIIVSADVNSIPLGWGRAAPYMGRTVVGDLLRSFVPKLYRVLIGDDLVHKFLVENPKKVLPIQN
jgi:phosphotriesterase-related protein